MEIGNFTVSSSTPGGTYYHNTFDIHYDTLDKLYYKFSTRSDQHDRMIKKNCVVYSLTDLMTSSGVDGYPNQLAQYLLDNTKNTYNFELISFDLQQKIKVCILSKEYVNQEIKDAWVFGLKRSITELEKYKVFRTIEEFDYYIKNEFNPYRNLALTVKTTDDEVSFPKSNATEKETQTTHNTSINTYDTVKQSVDEVNDYIKGMFNKTTNNKIELNSYTILEKAVEYYNKFDNEELDIVETIGEMLASKEYVLSDEFKKNKLDLKDIQFKFKMLTSPETITKNEILAEVFNIDNSVSLI